MISGFQAWAALAPLALASGGGGASVLCLLRGSQTTVHTATECSGVARCRQTWGADYVCAFLLLATSRVPPGS